eukprot:TRINITY_DN10885_c0_g1_i2.p1 TRINITY_DN10885_c0_g1~~TRINITY_DN10885_c0_g1_i2.p1  ORF type:complete len:127 (+),score=15.92 TRINITY_DN10885_c0_g1_i2:51-431(+)
MFIRNLSSVAKETSRSLDGKIITVFGGSGFLGRSIVRELSKEGAKVRVFSRTAQKLDAFQGLNVEYVKGNIADSSSVNQSLVGANGAVNLVGLFKLWLFKNVKLRCSALRHQIVKNPIIFMFQWFS